MPRYRFSLTTRPFSDMGGRASFGYRLANAAICAAETSTGVFNTYQTIPHSSFLA